MNEHGVRSVEIVYHREDGVWWADSPDMPGFSAAGDTFAETRKLAIEDLSFYFDDDKPNVVDERMEDGARLMPSNVMFLQMPHQGASRIERARGDMNETIISADRTRKLQVA